ncbi:MAG: alpha/beta hydrolase [Acholeplasma sp.]|nr:alpha/beta hydrolase [Acholeplasma sp.]
MPTFKYDEHEVYYDVKGEGKPILLLNGIMMSTRSWDVFSDTLSQHNKLIRVDFVDQGQSAKFSKSKLYSQDYQVDLIAALLNEIRIGKANVVGISYGAEVAIQFAIKYPELLNRLVLFNAPAYTSPWLRDIGNSWNEIGKTRNGKSYYLATIPVIYSPKFYERNLGWMKKREELLIPVFSNPAFLDAMERLTKSAEDYDARDNLSKITAKTLIIGALEDYLTPVANQYYLNEKIANSELILLPNVGHASMYEKPGLFVAIVLGYINALRLEYKI